MIQIAQREFEQVILNYAMIQSINIIKFKNQLYVNFSEIEDKSFNISEKDKTLNYSFYNKKQQ